MSYPFGGHPTLARFIEYARELGCQVVVDVRQTEAGRAYEALQIKNPDGGRLIIPDPDLAEHLSPSVVTNYQRRLGLKTPFAATPDDTSEVGDGS